jgi:hypothetical protein
MKRFKQETMSTDEIERWFDYLLQVGDKEGRSFQHIIESFNNVSWVTVTKSMKEFQMSMESMGIFDQRTIDEFWKKYITKRSKRVQNEINAEKDRARAEEERRLAAEQAELESLERLEKERKKKAKEAASAADKAQKEADEKERLRIDAMEDGQAKELALLQFNYEVKLRGFKKYALNEQLLKNWHEREIEKISEKYIDKDRKEREEIEKRSKAFNKKILNNKLDNEEFLYKARKEQIEAEELTEVKKQKKLLQLEAEFLKKKLAIRKAAGDITAAEEAAILAQIDGIMSKISNLGKLKGGDIYSLLGIKMSDENKKAIEDSTQFAIKQLEGINNLKLQIAEDNVRQTEREVEANENALQREIDNRNAGYASNVETAEKELKDAKRRQAQAIAEQRKAQREQQQYKRCNKHQV